MSHPEPGHPDPNRTWTEDDLIADVAAGPQGPRIGAFFDFDGTLIDGYSLGAFARHHLRSGHVTPLDAGRMLLLGMRGVTTEEDFESFFVLGMRAWAGRSEDELVELGERLWRQGVAGALYPEAWRLVQAHRRAGHTIVLASSATRFQVAPAAAALGVGHVLVTPVEVEDGLCTGRPGGPPLWRAGKAAAVRAFGAAHDLDLINSYAYSNGTEDVPFLATVGRARALNPEPGLAAAAAEKDWPSARFRSRGRPGVRELARTAGAVGGTLGGFGTGLALGAVNALIGTGTRRDAVDLGLTLGGELGTALGGITLDVRGAEHLATRPAVFLFNHQSQLDVLILAKLLRSGFSAVAKKEAARIPGFGLAFRLADVAFVDRSDTTSARAALEPAVQRLREGVSLVVAPEGTRSATPALGPFKKGAFHVAMQAGVPIVPIVIRNAGELMWKGASTLREGTIQITVLPPVPTDGWTVEELDKRVDDVRNRYLDALATWDGPTPGRPVRVTTGPTGPIAAPLEWGSAPEMNALEAAAWRAEAADPRLRANVTVLELLDSAPDWERLRDAHEWASRMVPRMRQRAVEPALGLGAPSWVTVDRIDIDRHLGRVRLERPTMRALLDAVAEFAAAPLDRDRPLWRAMLVEGLSEGRAAYVVVTHHGVTDGLGAVRLLGRLHSRTPAHDPDRPEPPVPAPGRVPTPVEVLAEQAGRRARGLPAEALRRGGRLAGALARPWGLAGDAVNAARTWRASADRATGGAPLLAERGGRWHLELLDVPLDPLRAGAAAAGGSVNDGLVAAVVEAFRRYHLELGAEPGELAVGVPISLRTPDDPPGADRLTAATLRASLAPASPTERVRAVREFVLEAGARTATDALSPVVGQVVGALPDALRPGATGWVGGGVDVRVGVLPGVGHAVHLAGPRITRVFPFGPPAGAAASVGLVPHDGTCCVGITLDPAAVTRPAVLTSALRSALADLAATAG
ncbi:HAD-IB family hydrolase [Pseudonocardia humida]|uniref:1-acyl-sn-glycerol-3-phosphate acyltransferase n=1 Tax=Pseudonocardia humida TaxID=2800819 RepID=A0ABT0ZS26_9PSEU|nr:HAD-IB family hydrolase [Pseudonocardia humida]MCO1653527.1 HAD-IB family hydrolase [Pseudonocardia humida]